MQLPLPARTSLLASKLVGGIALLMMLAFSPVVAAAPHPTRHGKHKAHRAARRHRQIEATPPAAPSPSPSPIPPAPIDAGADAPPPDAGEHPLPEATRAVPPVKPVKEVLLTFDDGPHLVYSPQVMAELDKRNIKVIFFVNGWHFDKDARGRAMIRTELEHGHYVGNHTYSHRILCKHINLAPYEIDHNEDLIQQTLGYRPTLLRTPYGQHCPDLKKIVAERGYDMINWDIDAQEWRHPSTRADQMAKYIIDHIARSRGRSIVLMHDTHLVTVQALPVILTWLDQHPEVKVISWEALLKPLPKSAVLEALGWVKSSITAVPPPLLPSPVPTPTEPQRQTP
jgi:peptidoglycan/xylan/chitin deacetylase (PgdA/CDA1 family)